MIKQTVVCDKCGKDIGQVVERWDDDYYSLNLSEYEVGIGWPNAKIEGGTFQLCSAKCLRDVVDKHLAEINAATIRLVEDTIERTPVGVDKETWDVETDKAPEEEWNTSAIKVDGLDNTATI